LARAKSAGFTYNRLNAASHGVHGTRQGALI